MRQQFSLDKINTFRLKVICPVNGYMQTMRRPGCDDDCKVRGGTDCDERGGYERSGFFGRAGGGCHGTGGDVLLTFHAPQDKWSLQGYVRNLENAVVITSAGAGFGYYNYALAPPRTYGVQFTYNK